MAWASVEARRRLAGWVALAVALALPAVAAAPGKAPADDDCLACHDDTEARRADGTPLRFAKAPFSGSVHGQAGLACVDCHADLAKRVDFPHADTLARVDCGVCHAEPAARYASSIHALAPQTPAGDLRAATCVDCHGSHEVLPATDPRSLSYPLRLPETCGRCHAGRPTLEKGRLRGGSVLARFEDSIHGKALRDKGLVVAPSCASCHGGHDIRRAGDPQSRVHRDAIPATCGGCHAGIKSEYETSIHWAQHAAGSAKGAVCSDCHSAHGIEATGVAAWRLDVVRECGTCHEDRIRTYRDGFHGKATELGYARVATCADCHGAHAIKAGTDPASMVHPERRAATCGKCHAGASASFALYDPHADPSDPNAPAPLRYTQLFMELLLGGVFTFFAVHTALWLPRSLKARGEERRD